MDNKLNIMVEKFGHWRLLQPNKDLLEVVKVFQLTNKRSYL